MISFPKIIFISLAVRLRVNFVKNQSPEYMLHASMIEHLQQRFSDFFSAPVTIMQFKDVYGGDTNKSFLLETNRGNFFIKVNAAMFGLDMFEKEARGLIQLADTGSIKVPRPLFDGKFNQQIFLVIEYVEPGNPAPDFWEDFGKSLSDLHRNSSEYFGLHANNYIGKLSQSNKQHNRWAQFYAEERILPLIYKANERNMLDPGHVSVAEQICSRLHSIFPDEQPALLHGDLWSGNYIVAANGYTAIFDPAVYYGHREVDIAMTLLFGGFDERFYSSYSSHFPLQSGWQERVALCQLYPLLVHLLLFGGKYKQKVIDTLLQYR